MAADDYSIQQLIGQLRTVHFQSYLLSHGWAETSSTVTDQRRFEADMNDGEGVYELYLPASADVAKDRTRLLRNIYKLCGIEDREPVDIAREMIAESAAVESPKGSVITTRVRVHNTGSMPMRVNVDAPKREHTLYASEAIEFVCSQSNSIEIERSDDAIVLRMSAR